MLSVFSKSKDVCLGNRHQIIVFIFLIFTALIQLNVSANPVLPIDMSENNSGQKTGSNYYYLIDNSRKLELDDVLGSKDWTPALPGVNNRGFSEANSWMKFILKNPNSETFNAIAEYVDPAIESIDLYHRTVGSDELFTHENFTFNKHTDTRPVSSYRPTFPIDLKADSSSEVFVKLTPGTKMPMHTFTSMQLWEENTFYFAIHKEATLLLILLITEVVMAFITLVLFYQTRDKLFLYYSIFAFSAASLFGAFSGLWSYFVVQEGYELWHVVLQINLCQIASILFIRYFLETKKHFPLVDKILFGIIFILVIGAVLNLIGYPYLSRVIIDYTAIAYVFFIPLGLYSHRKGVPHALLFTSSWVIFMLGMVLASMRLRGYINDSFISQWLIFIGGFIEIILLVTIMALRVLYMQREKAVYEQQYKTMLQDTAAQLKQKVEEQTHQLLEAKTKAENEARIDMLTGLTNRRAFTELAQQFVGRAKRHSKSKLYLAIIDIDHFKKVNDTFGHAAGDKVLRSVAKVLQKSIREVDVVSRIGGEEFAVLAESDNIEGIVNLFEYIRFGVENNKTAFNDFNISANISIGIASYSKGDTLDTLMQKADKALYKAKDQGRNQVVLIPDQTPE